MNLTFKKINQPSKWIFPPFLEHVFPEFLFYHLQKSIKELNFHLNALVLRSLKTICLRPLYFYRHILWQMILPSAIIFATLSQFISMLDEWMFASNNNRNYNKNFLSFASASSITPTSGGNQLPLAAEGFCAICQNNDDMGNLCAIGGCVHRFHRECFSEYLMHAQMSQTGAQQPVSVQCPLCRIDVNQQTLNESNIAASQMVFICHVIFLYCFFLYPICRIIDWLANQTCHSAYANSQFVWL